MTDTVMMHAAPAVAEIKSRVAGAAGRIREQIGRPPKLVALLIGDDPVSRTYVDLKRKDCSEVGITSEVVDLSPTPRDEMPSKVVDTLRKLNSDPDVDAIIPQMPFDGKVSEELVFSTLSPEKDVDGLTPQNLGKLIRREYTLEASLLPCTPKGVVLLAKHYKIPIAGCDVAVIGRSVLVGEPLRKLFQDLNATATCYHTGSKKLLDERVKEADIIVAASGRPPEMFGSSGFRLTADMVKESSSIFSVGVRRNPETQKMLFDIEITTLRGRVAFLTPNTGGVGAMTRACLLQNTIIAAEKAAKGKVRSL